MPTQVELEKPESPQRKLRGMKIGVVTSAKSLKTRVVTVTYQVQHRKYGKYLNRQTRYKVHDEQEVSGTGDRVEIGSCRPISKTKSWRLIRVIERGPEGESHVAQESQ